MDKIFAPRSRSMDERSATYQQEDFKYGTYDDIPTNEIPTRGIAYQTNYSNRSTHLETRTGTKEYGDDLTDPSNPVLSATIPSVFEDVLVDVEKSEPFTLTYLVPQASLGFIEGGVDINGWFISRIDSENKLVNDKIIGYGEAVNGYLPVRVATGYDLPVPTGQVLISLSAPVYGLLACKREDRCVMQVGGSLFVSNNLFMTEWNECQFQGCSEGGSDASQRLVLDASRSTLRELDGVVYVFNTNGIYRVDFSIRPAIYYKINSETPASRLTGINESEINPEEPSDDTLLYGRKRVYAYSRLSGDGARSRIDESVTLVWESGGVKVVGDDSRDYAVEWRTNEQAMLDTTSNILGLSFDSDCDSHHATHYSSYATRNIGSDTSVDTEIYPINISSDNGGVYSFTSTDVIGSLSLGELVEISGVTEPFTITQLESDGLSGQLTGSAGVLVVGANYSMTVTVITAGITGGNNPEELIWEMEIPLVKIFKANLTNGSKDFTTTSPIDRMWISTGFSETTLGLTRIATLATNGLSGTFEDAVTAPSGEYSLSVGAKSLASVTISGDTLTFGTAISLKVGQPIFFEDEIIRYVVGKTNQTVYTINNILPGSSSLTQIVGYEIGTIDSINSEVRDYDITVRSETMAMVSRFWQPLDNADLGDFLTGFCLVTATGRPMVEYCQVSTGYEYLIGQHNKFYQYTKLDDNVRDISGFNGLFAVKCDGSTKAINSISYVSSGNPDVGRFVFVLSTITDTSKNIGVVGAWCSIKIDGDTTEWVLTSEPALRPFDGKQYGANVLERRMMNRLRNLSTQFSLGFHPQIGLVIWGVE